MDVSQLRSALHEQAETLHDEALTGRADAARRRAHAMRRRQAIGALAAVAIVVPLLVLAQLGVNPFHKESVVEPAPEPGVPQSFAGRTLADSQVVVDGSELTLSHNGDESTQWTASCWGAGGTYTLHMALDGGSPAETPCETRVPPEPQMGYVLDRRFPTGVHTLRLWLTEAGSEAAVTVPGSVLAAGVYLLPEPVAVVAGVDVYEREVAFRQEWTYAGSRTSPLGGSRLEVRLQEPGRVLVQLVAVEVSSDLARLEVDGVRLDAKDVLDGTGVLAAPLPPGSHTVALSIASPPPDGAQLGIIWRNDPS